MSSPKLYKFDSSPPARSCMMACDIFEVPVKLVDVHLMNQEHKTPEYLKLNPLHTVPVFEDGDIVLHDSHAILMYLSDTYGKDDSFYPKDIKQRALVNQKLFFNNSVLFPGIRHTVYAAAIDKVKTLPDKIRGNIRESYDFLEEFLTRNKYLTGANMTIADLAAVATVSTLLYIVPLEVEKYPKIGAWLQELETKPFYTKHNEPGVKVVGQWIRGLIS